MMFTKISRYKNLDDVVFTDRQGREFTSKSIRLLPDTKGITDHIIEESDRLDHLAYKYYRQSRHWWKICDANPEFMSPRSLIGKDPIRTAEFPVVYIGVSAPWFLLKPLLLVHAGIEKVYLGNDIQALPGKELFDGVALFTLAVGITGEFEDSIYQQELTSALATAMSDAGHPVSTNIHLVKISDTRWELTDMENNLIYVFRDEGSLLHVYQGNIRHEWTVKISYNDKNINKNEIVTIINDSVFECETNSEIGRVGKSIVIPMKKDG